MAGLADRAAAGHRDGWLKLRSRLGRGWTHADRGFWAAVTGIPAAAFNGVNVYGDFDQEALATVLETIAAEGLPFTLQTRPAWATAAGAVARSLGMERQPAMPLMALTAVAAPAPVPRLQIVELEPADGDVHAGIVAEAFEAPLALMRELSTPALLGGPDITVLAGRWDGRAVATAMIDRNGPAAGILNVATLGPYRGRGIGTAITQAAVQRALASGADLAFLLATSQGMPIYRRLGFIELECWTSWLGIARG